MNLIRLIKLKLLFGELDELSTSEYDFINMFNNLKKYDRFYITKSDNTIRFKYYEDANVFWYSYDYVGVHFEFFYNYEKTKIDDMITNILRSKIGIKNISVVSN